MEDGEIAPDKPRYSNSPETSHQQPEDLYSAEHINCFLELPKGKRNVLLFSYFPGKGKFVKSAQ